MFPQPASITPYFLQLLCIKHFRVGYIRTFSSQQIKAGEISRRFSKNRRGYAALVMEEVTIKLQRKYSADTVRVDALLDSDTLQEPSADFGHDFAVFDSGFVLSLADTLIQAMLSRADVELPAVPGAGDDVSAQRALTERTAGVRTDAVEHMQDSIDIEYGKDSAIRDHFRTAARRNGCDIDQGDCSHGLLLLLLH